MKEHCCDLGALAEKPQEIKRREVHTAPARMPAPERVLASHATATSLRARSPWSPAERGESTFHPPKVRRHRTPTTPRNCLLLRTPAASGRITGQPSLHIHCPNRSPYNRFPHALSILSSDRRNSRRILRFRLLIACWLIPCRAATAASVHPLPRTVARSGDGRLPAGESLSGPAHRFLARLAALFLSVVL